jgi:Polyketide cyclase / dehydrase and lipid transport
METITRTDPFDVAATPDRVFPLLCPVREYDWIPGWECDLLHSLSGVAEEDCVFRTHYPEDGEAMTWIVTRYEPSTRIEFACLVPGSHVMRLKIVLKPQAGGTRLEWTRRWLSIGPRGDEWIASWSEARHREKMLHLERLLSHYLSTGEMLRT